MQTLQSLGAKIRYARRTAGLSQKQLGNVLQLSDKAVSSYEVNRAVPPVDTLKEISKITAQPLSYFLEDGEVQQGNYSSLDEKISSIEQELKEIKALLQRR